MKFIISLLLTALFAFALGWYLDWWSIAIAAFIVAVCIPQPPLKALFAGAFGIALLWAGYSFFLNSRNNGLLASKIAFVLPLRGNALLLILVTAFIGGAVGGLAALSGSFLRKAPSHRVLPNRKGDVALERAEPAI